MEVKTRILIISDTHAEPGALGIGNGHRADVVIHCGDLTEESKIEEYRQTLQLLQSINAPLKLAIAGNHDFTLDVPAFRRKVEEAIEPLEPELVQRTYGNYGEARRLIDASGITFLDEGTHQFKLDNGARMTVYASPFTPSKGGNGFQYHPEAGHDFSISSDVDVVITHGPPHGIMDYAHGRRAGCPYLFKAVAKARPRLHCFGHIHEGWGAKLLRWRDAVSQEPSHFVDIDNGRSVIVEKLSNITRTNFDTPESILEKRDKATRYTNTGFCSTSHCQNDTAPLERNKHTLFINAAIQGVSEELPTQPAWLVDIELPRAEGCGS
ncbi:ser/Thr protein phosphatase family protein [Xylariaceae sp. FL0804]|nr:ser/Thr protein phosphatase family protein [Xylariaceae sp. FL0804]